VSGSAEWTVLDCKKRNHCLILVASFGSVLSRTPITLSNGCD
jgi:hypothetical protein